MIKVVLKLARLLGRSWCCWWEYCGERVLPGARRPLGSHLFFFFFSYAIFKNLFIFNWRIIVLQYCVGFCQTSVWSVIGTYWSPPFWTFLPPTSLPIPPLLVVTEPHFEFPESYSKFPLVLYFTCGYACSVLIISVHPTLSFLPAIHKSVLCICVSIAALQIISSVTSF